MKKYQDFLPENFNFLVVKFSVYLNRLVFVMVYHYVHVLPGIFSNNSNSSSLYRFHAVCIV